MHIKLEKTLHLFALPITCLVVSCTDKVTSRIDLINSDIKAIKDLRERDAEAAKSLDLETLRSLVSDEAVLMPPGEKPLTGKAELDAAYAQMSNDPKSYEILEYAFDLSEPEIIGSFAFEHGAIRGVTRKIEDGTIENSSYHVLRILRKEGDKEWKVYRAIWTSNR
ncbi:MAG: DUF4440 domain-containing protein [Cyanothece sp. SIO1E1]|nr:DUF4440 domain-containing protein [Cyanothece sp. SIO1E1]